jgi:phenylalanyl-tRNA synthetase beta chain
MPVINLFYNRLAKIMGRPISKQTILDNLPYLGLDLEEETDDYVKVEYNPNRPDFSSEWGIARALKGFLEFEKGLPQYSIKKSNIILKVNKSIIDFRPFFVGAVVRGVKFDDESIKQIMVMQDDLDNGIGRRRSKVSTGIHNLDAVDPPFEYKVVTPDFRFNPLGYNIEKSMKQILQDFETGRNYGHIVEKFAEYPIIIDSNDNVLSFPPIINGEVTRVSTETKNLFIDITSTNMKSAEDVLAVLLTALADMGGKLESIEVQYPTYKKITPDLATSKMIIESSFINRLLGMNLSPSEIIKNLNRSRLDAKISNDSIEVSVPRYRSDIIHPIDIVEEVLLGYNVANLTPTIPESAYVGSLNSRLMALDSARDVFIGLGLIEVMHYSLISSKTIVRTTGKEPEEHLKVKNPKTGEHEYLRYSLIPSILSTLSKNIHEEYPQRIFEVNMVFNRNNENPNKIEETNVAAVAIAHANANYTEVKSYCESFLDQYKAIPCSTKAADQSIYIPGRSAELEHKGSRIGKIGEIAPAILEAFNLRVPVSAFEINLESI